MKTKAILAAILLLAASLTAAANSWSVEYIGTTNSVSRFIISRSGDLSITETVLYRTVSLSALQGQHFTKVSDYLTFGPNEGSKDVYVTECIPTSAAYKYQNGQTRTYRLEVTDQGGFQLAYVDREINTGSGTSVSSTSFRENKVVVNSGEITVTDNNYSQAYHAVPLNNYFGVAAPKEFFVLAGAELRMTLSFQAKEKDDGYQHVQILVNQTSNHDEGAGDNNPGTINYSSYMATFCHMGGLTTTTYADYVFPDVTHGDNCGDVGDVWDGNPYGQLRQQKFKTNCRADDGRLIIASKSALSNLSTLGIRFDASGNNEDTWYANNTVANIQAVDVTAPTLLSTAAVAPGVHAIGNTVYISVAFSEPVRVINSSTKLKTTWGDYSCNAGGYSNVLTFWGTIGENASEPLSITGLTGNIVDLSENRFSGTISGSNLCPLNADYNYSISYDLAGGSLPSPNPTSYTYHTSTFTLNIPTLEGYYFRGWTGSNGSTPQRTVSIDNLSHGNRHYTANWERLKYKISFNKNHSDATGAMDNMSFEWNEEKALSINQFQRNGCRFKAWNTQADGQGTSYSDQQVVSNLTSTHNAVVTLYAQWEQFWGIDDGADGSEEHPYLIAALDDLEYLSERVNAYNMYLGKYFKLMNDISLTHGEGDTEHNFTPIGTNGDGFQGTFDGQGFTISGLRVYLPDKLYVGFFGRVRSGTVRNLILDDARITGKQYVGGITGVNAGSDIHNCLVTGSTIFGKNAGVIIGSHSGSYSRNYYRGCSVVGEDQNNGASAGKPLYTITLGSQITLAASRTDGIPVGQNKTFYANGITMDGAEYYTSGTTITLGYSGEVSDNQAVVYNVSEIGALPGNSFTMPSADVSVSASFVACIHYLDADGTEHSLLSSLATPIISSDSAVWYDASTNGETWYYVTGEQSINGELMFDDQDVRLILCDGATLTVTNTSVDGIYVPYGALSIYAQSDGNQRGRLVVNGANQAFDVGHDIVINGGSVNAVTSGDMAIYSRNGSITIRRGEVNAQGPYYGLYANQAVTIYGGAVNARATATESGSGIYTKRNEVKILGGIVTVTGHDGIIPAAQDSNQAIITLGWSTPDDRITATNYGGVLKVQDGQTLYDGNTPYSGTLTDGQKAAIANKTLAPYPGAGSGASAVTARKASLAGQERYWATFYSDTRYALPAGAQAFIMKDDHVLYRLGDGSVIPANCAVVIMAEASALTNATATSGIVTFTPTSAEETSSSGNILRGVDTPTAKASLVTGSQKVYVMGKNGETFGFFEFSGDTVPANKAYYVEE
ncbi:MAG: InlB B-repeat-containing protein [Bacteroidales bacterium]|nr:InlB B-repeat-containing protein [Bacteroidales bacterium]